VNVKKAQKLPEGHGFGHRPSRAPTTLLLLRISGLTKPAFFLVLCINTVNLSLILNLLSNLNDL
jgi:hypothetical protein